MSPYWPFKTEEEFKQHAAELKHHYAGLALLHRAWMHEADQRKKEKSK